MAEVGVDERSGFEMELVPVDLLRDCGGDFPAQEGCSGGGIGESSLEELVVRLVDGLLGHGRGEGRKAEMKDRRKRIMSRF